MRHERSRQRTTRPGWRRRRAYIIAAACLIFTAGAAAKSAPDNFSPRVRSLIQAMTLQEKTDFITGAYDPQYRGQSGYAPGVPRLTIPPLRWGNGPVGIEVETDATAVPGGFALAATFDEDLARRTGWLLGREARAHAVDVINGPQLDIARIPTWGRNQTSLGEDPLLLSRLGVAQVQGIQDQGVMATPKHYVAYSQAQHVRSGTQQNATPFDFLIDARTLREIYLPGFEAAAVAGAASFMASHMIVNGFWGSENRLHLTEILRDDLGWDGFVVSDWNATHSANALIAGTDVEMPGYGIGGAAKRPYFFGDRLAAQVMAGRVPEAAVDRAASRLLKQMERFGFLDGTRVVGPTSVDIAAGAKVAREVAAKGAVLLKNDGILPLRANLSSTLLIGPTAAQLAVGAGNGRAFGVEERLVSPLAAMHTHARNVAFVVGDDLTGAPIPGDVLQPTSGQGRGLERVAGSHETVDGTLDFAGPRALPARTNAKWIGRLSPPETGDYLLMIQTWGGSATLKVDGVEKAASAKVNTHGFARKWASLVPTTDGLDNGQANVRLEARRSYKIEVDLDGNTGSRVQARLAWVTPAMRRANIADAVAAARRVDTAVVFAWARSGEFVDADERLRLPNDQDDLIAAVAAANPNTVVVLNTGGPVRMPWLERVRAVLQMWYPGQEGGWATADLLTGKLSPSGRLPITFPATMEDTPAGDPRHPERSVGIDRKLIQSEGLFVGYRHYDRNDIRPLFPFGHGLSYSKFAYSRLRVDKARDGYTVRFSVKNLGSRTAAEVPQVYLGPAASPIPMPQKSLAGFERIELAPGKSRTVRMPINQRQLSFWSVEDRDWTVLTGKRPIYVGASSRDIRLTGTLGD